VAAFAYKTTPAARAESVQGWMMPAAIFACAVFLYLETFVLPCLPRSATGDQAIYLHDAARMAHGQVIYRDFDHFTFPGTSALYFLLFKVFGIRAWIPQLMLVVLGTSTAWLSFLITRKLVRGAAAFLPGLLFVTMPFTGYLDATHHWYSTLAVTAALAVLMERRSPSRIAYAGFLWGVATCFAQSQVFGVMGMAIYLVWEGLRTKEPRRLLRKKECLLLASYLIPVVACNAYFAAQAGFGNFFYNTVVFVTKYYPRDPSNTWHAYLGTKPAVQTWGSGWADMPAWLLVTLLVPLIYILFFVRYGRKSGSRQEVPWERLMLVTVTGISMLLTVASAATYNRLYTVSLPALILLVWFLDAPLRIERMLLRGLWVTALILIVAKPTITQTRWHATLELPTGRTAFFKQAAYEKTEWLLERVHRGDYFFGDQLMGFALDLRNPGPVAFITPTGYTRPEEVNALVQGFERHHVQYVSCYGGLWDNPERSGNPLGPLWKELQEHYRVAATFANGDTVWERKF
jgi:Dolichyl-phosphate-mannose-protein mannosyltransferase